MKSFHWNTALACLGLVLSLFIPDPVWSDSDIINADCSEQITCLTHDTSRSRLCLDFTDKKEQCVVTGMVGGEHVTTLEVAGKADDSIFMKFKSLSGKPGYSISGDGASIHCLGQGQAWIKLSSSSPLFEISISAHPYGEFAVKLRTTGP
ncbi:MAG: hypothetical protein GY860_16435 [Desulfobacteraceae bacterium]|nr:hypothetical protein [Desulfobacteraceae bacterium]